RRQLEDEAELAVVVARAHAIEQRGRDLRAERLAPVLRHGHGELEAAATQLELRVGIVDQQPVLDHVARDLAVDADDLIAGEDAGGGGRGRGRDGHHLRAGHARQDTGRGARSLGPWTWRRSCWRSRAGSAPAWRWRSRPSPGWCGSSSP